MTQQADRTRIATSADVALTHAPLPFEAPPTPGFDPGSIEQILAIEDDVLRPLWMAQRSHELAGRLTPFLGVDQSWCTFAVWRAVGLSRFVDLDQTVVPSVDDETVEAIDRRLVPARALRLASSLDPELFGRAMAIGWADLLHGVARGHDRVFAELAPLFERLTRVLEAGTYGPDRVQVLDEIGVATRGPRVRVAFGQYVAAVHDADPIRRAERVLAANLLLTLHGEELVQAEVGEVADRARAVVDETIGGVVAGWLPARRRWLGSARRDLVATVGARWNEATMAGLARFVGPEREIDLGGPPSGEWPSALQVPSISVLVEVLDQWATDEAHGDPTWDDIDQRMRMLERLLRGQQQADGLASAPFGRRQLEAMRRLERPSP